MDFPSTRDEAKLPLKAIANLINSCEAVDQLDEGMLVLALPQEFYHPSLDRDRDLPLWEDRDGQLKRSLKEKTVETDSKCLKLMANV
ncbi:MAG: hypothetical protein F6K50_19950 [Moorea sp. SIO3I7]|uniref:hypothetical protein n=1 Tax=Moorena sp. SIO3I8 TaxID=2607833 RepID=UPI0013BEF624|nr:hypothetical protein [Moorena sp. SIO3I8]NEN97716.1 hypothetical protein [Moorena sp. SIO3I7]NEO07712.1 hypothetical protein [Moorena sp. SIO3I8]